MAKKSNNQNRNRDAKEQKKSKKDDVIEVKGRVLEALPNATFRVELENGQDRKSVV